ncbi:efflux RND transporter periplasmic adaptor subunit [Nitrosococcus oceani]|uniref:efflux RND transporter periplasmic adaptor subunit n=1 Tax=Nitrosococcus oceani TaxID=1229 RepID=UPI000A9E1E56|nr:efflux RND transporter periplasmic adaptor subunit [Nitrosococcus oceani]
MLKVILPLALLLVGMIASWAIVQSPMELAATPPKAEPPQVEIMAVEPRSVRLKIRSQGTIRACTDMKLTAQVDGKVVKMAPGFKEGKFFREGDVLIQIEPRDYDLAVVKAQARVAAAQGELLREEAKADLARKDWESIGKGEPSPLMLRIPELKEARARLQAAKAALEEARLRRERTELRAPFNGRVQERWVEVGEYVEEGTHLARLFAVDRAEARLPLTPSELAFLDLPLAPRQNLGEKGPKVMLQASLAGKRHSWEGRIVRTEGVIDEKTRMLYAVAEVRDPYGDLGLSPGAPLLVGLFVEAEIEGRTLDHAHLLPRQALRQGSQVLVVNDEHRVSFREVEVLRVEGKWAVVQGSLRRGEAVVVSPLPQAVEGMEVKIGPA